MKSSRSKNCLSLGIVTLSALVLTTSLCEAGPRGGGGRGGAARPSAPSPSFNRPSPSGSNGPSQGSFNRGSSELGGGNLGNGNFGNRDLGNFNPGDRNLSGQQRLSGVLEGQGPSAANRPASKQQLNDFLGLSDGTQDRATDHQQQADNRQQNLDNHQQQWNDRQQQWNDRQQQWNDGQDDRQDNRQSNVDQTKQNVSERSNEIYNNVNHYLDGQPQPFTASWYSQHPNAWQYSHPHADAWAAASFGAVTGWVAGMATTPVSYNYNTTTAYVEGTDSQPSSSEAQTEEAQQLTQSSTPASSDEEWMPIGVYALVQGNQTKSQMLMQISVSKSGQIGGSYYNVLSDNSQPLSGSVDKQTQKVAWTVAGNQKAIFQTDLNGLTQPETPVLVHYGNGETEQMTLVRMPDNT